MLRCLARLLPVLFVCVTVLAQAPSWQPEFQAALALAQRGEVAQAKVRFSSLWTAHPQDFQLAYQIGTALDMAGDHRAATPWYQRSLKLSPEFAPAKNNLSLNYASLGEFSKALPLLEGLARGNPSDARLQYNLGLVRLQLKRYAPAALAFARAGELAPGNRDAALRLAYSALMAGNRQQGLAALKTFLALPGDARESAAQAVQILNAAHCYREAAAQARSLAVSAGSPTLTFAEGVAIFHLGDFAKAARTLAQTAPPSGSERDYHILLGSAQALSGDLPAAVQSMQSAVTADPRSPEAYYRLALVFLEGSREEDARKVLASGLEQVPGSALLWYAQAVANLDSGRDEEALGFVDRSIQIDRNQPEAWSLMGELKARLGDYDKAQTAFGTALKLGADPETAVKYAELLVRLERLEEADKVLQQVLAGGRANAHAYRGLGRLYKARKDYPRAYDALKRAVELDPADADAHFQLGETLRWLDRLPEAREQYAAAAEKKRAATEASRLLRRAIAPAGPELE